MAHARSLITYLIVALYVVIVGTPALVLSILTSDSRILFWIGRACIRLALLLVGIRRRIAGGDKLLPGRTYVFVANHTSNLDPPVLLVSIPRDLRFIAKRELAHIPLLSRAMRVADFVFVDRRRREDAQAAVDRAAAVLQRGFSFLVFPEGTRSVTGQLSGFKKGAFVLAIKAGVEVVPVTLRGSHAAMPKGSLIVRPAWVSITFHDPIPTQGLTYNERDTVLEQAHEVMAKALSLPGA